jgi:hypothetical protein
MRGIQGIGPMHRKNFITTFMGGLFRKYAQSRLLMPLISGIVPSFIIRFMKRHARNLNRVSEENREKLSETVYDSKSGNFRGVAPW